MDTVDAVAEEQHGLTGLFDQLTPSQLAWPSLCGAWTVHDIAAHLVTPLAVRTREFLLTMLASRGNFERTKLRCSLRDTRPQAQLRHDDTPGPDPEHKPAQPRRSASVTTHSRTGATHGAGRRRRVPGGINTRRRSRE